MRPRIPSRVVEGLLFALTAFGPFAFGGVEPWSRAAIQTLALILALIVFIKGRPAASSAGAYFWLLPAAVAALGYLQLSTVTMPGDPRPAGPFTATPHETRSAVMLWVTYAAVLWSVPRVIVSPDAARRYSRFLLAIGLVLGGGGLLQLVVGGDKLLWLRAGPRFASYYNRDHAANVLLMSLAVGIGLIFAQTRRRSEIEGGSHHGVLSSRPFLAGSLVVVFGALLSCSSQASLLAIPLAAAALAFLGADFAATARRRRFRAGAAIAGAALTVFFAYHHVAASADAGGLVERAVMGRLSIYGDAWRWFRDAPLFGTGLGGFETIYPSYQDLGLTGTVSHAHSDWIEFALETGLVGLLWALLTAILLAYIAARSWREARSGEMRCLIGGALGAAAAFAAHSLFEFAFQIPANAVLFFAILGFLLSAPSWAGKSSSCPPVRPPGAGGAILAAAYCLVLLRAALMPAAAAWKADEPGGPVERVVALAEAVALDEDPDHASQLSVAAYKASGDGPQTDYVLMRLSLRYALAAAERRPFSADVLYLTAETLRRLERPVDSREYFSRMAAVRFSRIQPKRGKKR